MKVQAIGTACAAKIWAGFSLRTKVTGELIDRGESRSSGHADERGRHLWKHGCAVRPANIDIVSGLKRVTRVSELPNIDDSEAKWLHR
jgi:hypothetical protein